MTLELYEGVVTVIPIVQSSPKQRKKTGPAMGLEVGELGEPSQARIEELFVRSSAFMYCEAKSPPRMALLYEDTLGRVKLKVRELIFTPAGTSGDGSGVADLNEVDILREELEMGASHLIPVPAPLGMNSLLAAVISPEPSLAGLKKMFQGVVVHTH
jgi:DNA damage-binding protein 1